MNKSLVLLCFSIFGTILLVTANDEGMCMAPSSENPTPDCGDVSEAPKLEEKPEDVKKLITYEKVEKKVIGLKAKHGFWDGLETGVGRE